MMNVVSIIKKKIDSIRTYLFVRNKAKELQKELETSTNENRIFFFCTPTHSNLGDQAQLYCWLNLMKEWYPEHKIVCVPTRYRQSGTIRTIRNNMGKEDLIFIHSGYLMFDLNPELPFILDIVMCFYDTRIIILPQTVNITAAWYQQVIARTFDAHKDLYLICRDAVSMENAKRLFTNVKLKQMPDVVTSLIGNDNFKYTTSRNGVMLCVRNDVEKLYSNEQINALKAKFNGRRVSVGDTTISANMWEWETKREKLLHNILKRLSSYQVIITDRFHGTIFSQIVNTPVVVISSTDHKLSSGVKWFPQNLFGQNIAFAKDLDDAYDKAMEFLNRDGKVIENPDWFRREYYSHRITV